MDEGEDDQAKENELERNLKIFDFMAMILFPLFIPIYLWDRIFPERRVDAKAPVQQ